MAEQKRTPAKDAPTPDPSAIDQPTPRPDPVGERNYRLSQPVIRPEGEGTPGAMRTPVPAETAVPAPAVVPTVDAVKSTVVDEDERKRRQVREESEKRAHAPVPPKPA